MPNILQNMQQFMKCGTSYNYLKLFIGTLNKVHRKGFNSLCILGAWTLWKHRNACVFDGMTPNLQRALQDFKDESLLWRFAGLRGLLP